MKTSILFIIGVLLCGCSRPAASGEVHRSPDGSTQLLYIDPPLAFMTSGSFGYLVYAEPTSGADWVWQTRDQITKQLVKEIVSINKVGKLIYGYKSNGSRPVGFTVEGALVTEFTSDREFANFVVKQTGSNCVTFSSQRFVQNMKR